MTPFLPGGVSDGNWHTILIRYYNKVGLGVILSAFSAVYMYSLISTFGPCFDIIKPTSLTACLLEVDYQGCNRSIKMPSKLLHLISHTPRPLKQTYKSPLALGGVYGNARIVT